MGQKGEARADITRWTYRPIVSLGLLGLLVLEVAAELFIPGFERLILPVGPFLPKIASWGLIAGLLVDVTWTLVRRRARSTPRPLHVVRKQTLQSVHRIFDFVSLVVPSRIAKEDIGEALEIIVMDLDRQRPAWRIWLKVGSTLFWIFGNARKEFMASFSDKKNR